MTICETCLSARLNPEPVPNHTLSTSFSTLLASNDAPSEADENIFRSYIQSRAATLATLDNQIVAFTNTLSSLKSTRSQVATHIANHKIVMHPIRRLGGDILSEIFEACRKLELDDEFQYTGALDSLNTKRMPWVLSHVCSRWRDVALSLPGLWSSLSLNLDKGISPTPHQKITNHTMLLSLYTTRSKLHPLSVRLFSSETEEESDRTHPFLPLIFPSAPRWHRLHIDESTLKSSNARSLSHLHHYISALHTLHISWDTPDVDGDTPLGVGAGSLFHDTRALRVLVVTGAPAPSSMMLPWHQIQRYKWFGTGDGEGSIRNAWHFDVFVRASVAALNAPTTLSGLTSIDIDTGTDSITSSLAPLSLPNLTSMTLRSGAPEKLICALTAPGLEELYTYWAPHVGLSVLAEFLERSSTFPTGHPLAVLKLTGIHHTTATETATLRHVLSLVSKLKDLSVESGKFVVDGVIGVLTIVEPVVVSLDTPVVNADAPAVNADAPAVNADAPAVDADAPAVDGDAATVNTDTPPTDTDTPPVNTEPTAELPTPEPETICPALETLTFKLSHRACVNIPAFVKMVEERCPKLNAPDADVKASLRCIRLIGHGALDLDAEAEGEKESGVEEKVGRVERWRRAGVELVVS